MKAEAELRKWRVNPKTLAITPPVISRNYAKECLTGGALQFKIPIDGVKLLQTMMAEAAKKNERRPSKKKKAPLPSPSPPQHVRTVQCTLRFILGVSSLSLLDVANGLVWPKK